MSSNLEGVGRILHFRKNGEEDNTTPKSNPQDRENAREWLQEMGFVIDDEEQPQSQPEPAKRKPAA